MGCLWCRNQAPKLLHLVIGEQRKELLRGQIEFRLEERVKAPVGLDASVNRY